ncbi:unknown protein 1 isoform X2 [Rutidosis leptorrhynchoides]
MDTKAIVEQIGVNGVNLCKSVNNVDKNAMENEDVVLRLSSLPLMVDDGFALSPITPDSNKENLELISGIVSPLSLVSTPPNITFYMSEDDDDRSPSTPKEGVFDPFAPGPDNLMLAPVTMKYLEESRSFVARRLNFNSVLMKNCREMRENGFEDELLVEAVYDSLLEVIISKQAEDMAAEISAVDLILDDEIKTPPFAPRITGIAETCPCAPLKAVKKSRNIDLGLCRKLEFDL